MPDGAPDYLSMYEKMGDIAATLRVVKHDTANNSAKLDALGTLVISQGHVAADVEKLKGEVQELKDEKNRRDGAISLGEWIVKIVPWLVGGGAFAVIAKMIGMGT
ncbi:MAG TPA: hypothetical protein VE053_06660 [Allosphingosinicella sp.]|nr:hypothetical protein [Allosphingosinicella sp.]